MPLSPDQAVANASSLCAHLCQRHIGDRHNIELLCAALVANGHVLIEGAPGLGKTRLVRTLASALKLDFGRVQCTPDCMPTDFTGCDVLNEAGKFSFAPGPIFKNIVLADEVNRATPRSQSALLESMEERQVTAGALTHSLPKPFFLAATQNPIELEGTYPLPEAQLDRFLFKLELGRPNENELRDIFSLGSEEEINDLELEVGQLENMQDTARQLPLIENATAQVARIISASHPDDANATPDVKKFLRYGASPRAGIAAISGARALALVRGRAHVAPQDLRDALLASLRHRVVLHYEAIATGVTSNQIVEGLLNAFPVE